MALEIIMRKVLAGEVGRGAFVLVPVDHLGAEDFAKCPRGENVFVTVTATINDKKWRLFQALVAKLAEAHPNFHDRDEALEELCSVAGHVRKSYNKKTKTAVVSRKSTSPTAFKSGAEFDRFFDRCFYFVHTELLPGVPEGALRKEIEEMTAPNLGGVR